MSADPHGLAAVSLGGLVSIFRLEAGLLQQRYIFEYPDGTLQEAWTAFDGPSPPSDLVALAAATGPEDTMTIFVLTRSGQLFCCFFLTEPSSWGKWESLGGPVFPPIAAASLCPPNIEVHAMSGEGSMVTRHFIDHHREDGSYRLEWAEWETLSYQPDSGYTTEQTGSMGSSPTGHAFSTATEAQGDSDELIDDSAGGGAPSQMCDVTCAGCDGVARVTIRLVQRLAGLPVYCDECFRAPAR